MTRPYARRAGVVQVAVALLAAGCDGGAQAETKAAPAATVEHPRKESDLATVRLSAEAETRLDIPAHLAAVERRAVPRTRLYGGVAAVPTGRSIALAAPVAATVLTPGDGGIPVPGQSVRRGEALLSLLPIIAPGEALRISESLAAAGGDVAMAEARTSAAGAALRRAHDLARDGAGSRRALEEAQAQADVAQAALDAARVRLEVAASASRILAGFDAAAPSATGLAVDFESPLDGAVRAVHVIPGAKVPAGAPLLDLESLDPLWVRVAVPAAELDDVDLDAPARIASLGAGPEQAGIEAPPVRPAPPIASLEAGAVELSYVLQNAAGGRRPDERITAWLALRGGGEERLVVPWSAVLHDIHGGAWVYERTAPQVFVRRRVAVERVEGATAVLARAPDLAPGARIVTAGAAELFGIEFGGGK